MTNNKNVLNWIEEMKALVKPDKVVWIDGSEAQLQELRDARKRSINDKWQLVVTLIHNCPIQ